MFQKISLKILWESIVVVYRVLYLSIYIKSEDGKMYKYDNGFTDFSVFEARLLDA